MQCMICTREGNVMVISGYACLQILPFSRKGMRHELLLAAHEHIKEFPFCVCADCLNLRRS